MDVFQKVVVLVWSLCCWEAQAVNGKSPEYSLRLVGGDSRCRGELQIQRSEIYLRQWTAVFPMFIPPWFGHRLCAELDCGPALTVDEIKVPKREAVSLMNTCDETSLIHCFGTDTYLLGRSLVLHCSDSVRLVSGQSVCSGSLQIRDQSVDQSWTWVCEGALDRRGAEVLCRELGCGAPLLQGDLSSLGQTFHCEGHESALMDCPHNHTRTNPETCPGLALNLTCSEPVRLVGGAGRCEGIVELKHRGEWRRMATDGRWDLENAAGVCRVLDCGSAVSTENRYDYNESKVWALRPDCEKKTALRDCVVSGFAASAGLAVVCSDSVRLVSGQSVCSGSLQIRDQSLNQSWTWVCEGALDRRGVEVLCRELGCGAPLLLGELSSLGQMFYCEGHESALMDCPHSQTRTNPGNCSGPALNLTCSEPLRLVGGASHCEGTVELHYRGQWREVVTPHYPWTREAAATVCRDLDCGSVVSTTDFQGPNGREVWAVRSDCVKRAAVRDCVFGGLSTRFFGLRLVCSGHQGPP